MRHPRLKIKKKVGSAAANDCAGLAYSTLLKEVMPLPFHLFALFDVYFPIVLFGILSLSFLVHILALGAAQT